MNGFEIFLCVLAGIILFFVGVLSVPVHISVHYKDKVFMTVRYAFLKFEVLPLGEKKAKKPKKEKEEKEKEEKGPKEKKPNPILKLVKANGLDGMIEIIENLGSVLAKWGGKLFRSVKFNLIEVYATIGTGDAASTAIRYGEMCQKVFPPIGFICSNNLVKKYDIDIKPDFLANSSENELNIDCSLIIRKILNATVAMGVRVLFKVLLKFLINGKKDPSEKVESKKAAEKPLGASSAKSAS